LWRELLSGKGGIPHTRKQRGQRELKSIQSSDDKEVISVGKTSLKTMKKKDVSRTRQKRLKEKNATGVHEKKGRKQQNTQRPTSLIQAAATAAEKE